VEPFETKEDMKEVAFARSLAIIKNKSFKLKKTKQSHEIEFERHVKNSSALLEALDKINLRRAYFECDEEIDSDWESF